MTEKFKTSKNRIEKVEKLANASAEKAGLDVHVTVDFEKAPALKLRWENMGKDFSLHICDYLVNATDDILIAILDNLFGKIAASRRGEDYESTFTKEDSDRLKEFLAGKRGTWADRNGLHHLVDCVYVAEPGSRSKFFDYSSAFDAVIFDEKLFRGFIDTDILTELALIIDRNNKDTVLMGPAQAPDIPLHIMEALQDHRDYLAGVEIRKTGSTEMSWEEVDEVVEEHGPVPNAYVVLVNEDGMNEERVFMSCVEAIAVAIEAWDDIASRDDPHAFVQVTRYKKLVRDVEESVEDRCIWSRNNADRLRE